MKIAVIGGLGYVGLVSGACLADLGNEVICTGLEEYKIEMLTRGVSPIYEPGLEDILYRNSKDGRLTFTTDNEAAVHKSDVIFITVGTPSLLDGSADLSQVRQAVKDVARALASDPQPRYRIIVNKSTVPVGTGEMVKQWIIEVYKGRFDVVSNPEFLREGTAVIDFSSPDRIVVGCESDRAQKIMSHLYEPQKAPIVWTNIKTAEMIKYAANAYLATSISFINSIASLCEVLGADVTKVAEGMRYDERIGRKAFLDAGIGYGGSCFPKDVKALIQIGKENKVPLSILQQVEAVNKTQKKSLMPKIDQLCPNLKGKKVAVWGLAFKPNTDDMREAPSLEIIEALQQRGARVVAFDPVAVPVARKILPGIDYAESSLEAVAEAYLLVVVTRWNEFEGLDLLAVKEAMAAPNIVDGRNIYDPLRMEELGFKYLSVGR